MPPEPAFDPQYLWIWRAWHRLHSDRPHWGGGMGPVVPGNIPWLTIAQWAERHRMTPGEHAMLDYVLIRMDQTYHDWWVTKQRAVGALT